MRERQKCDDCGKLSPETETNYTLISSQFGWRLTRWRDANGVFNIQWRCPDCWRAYKRIKQAAEGVGAAADGPSPMPSATRKSGRPTPLQTGPLPSFPSRPPAPAEAIGPLPPAPRLPRGSRPLPPRTRKPGGG